MKPGFFKRLAAAAPSKVAAAPDAYHDDWLHVENGVVMDMNGNEVWMTGVNWFGYNVGSQVFDGAWSANVHNCLKLISDHGFNLLRVPMSTQILLQWKNGEPDPIIKLNEYENPELKVEGVVGGTPMSGGVGSIVGTLLGTFIICVLSNGMNIMGLSSEIQQIAKGIVLILAVFATIDRKKIGVIK